jgi:hypothetical protein
MHHHQHRRQRHHHNKARDERTGKLLEDGGLVLLFLLLERVAFLGRLVLLVVLESELLGVPQTHLLTDHLHDLRNLPRRTNINIKFD